MQVVGVMVSSFKAVPFFAQFHMCPLQSVILACWNLSPHSLDRAIRLPETVKQSLLWWLQSPRIQLGRSCLPISWQMVTTDASLTGWGGTFRSLTVQGRWSKEETLCSINVLEYRAIHLCLNHWTLLLSGHPVRVQSDNATAVAYNHRGKH